jgi:hypothetical protein
MKKTDLCAIMLLFASFCFATSCSKMEEETISVHQNEVKNHIDLTIDNRCFDLNSFEPLTPCPNYYRPVCACNEYTFPNSCQAEAWGFKNYTQGACVEPVCYSAEAKFIFQNTYCPTDQNITVCGCDGNTYPSACEARREGIMLFTEGSCENRPDVNIDSLIRTGCFNPEKFQPITPCPAFISPVCACKTFQFSNGCEAEANGFENYEQGPCENRCKSEAVGEYFSELIEYCEPQDEICGCDGVTYNGPCNALRNGVLRWIPGPCRGFPIEN